MFFGGGVAGSVYSGRKVIIPRDAGDLSGGDPGVIFGDEDRDRTAHGGLAATSLSQVEALKAAAPAPAGVRTVKIQTHAGIRAARRDLTE